MSGRRASALAIPRTMNDGKHSNLVRLLVHLIDDDVGRFHKLPCSFGQSWSPNVREPGNYKSVGAGENTPAQFGCRARIVLGNPL